MNLKGRKKMKKYSHIFLLESQTALLEVPKTPEGECEQEIKPGAESPSATALPSLCCSKVYEARCTAYLEPALKFFIRLLTSVDAAESWEEEARPLPLLQH